MTDDDLDRRLREALGEQRASPDLVARLTASARPRSRVPWAGLAVVVAAAATLLLVVWPDAPDVAAEPQAEAVEDAPAADPQATRRVAIPIGREAVAALRDASVVGVWVDAGGSARAVAGRATRHLDADREANGEVVLGVDAAQREAILEALASGAPLWVVPADTTPSDHLARAQSPDLLPCYDAALARQPDATPPTWLLVEVAAGRSTDVRPIDDTPLDPSLRACLFDAVRDWVWPVGMSGTQDVRVTLDRGVPVPPAGVQAAFHVHDLDDAAYAALDGHALRDRPGELVPIEADFEAPDGAALLAAPTLEIPWGQQGSFYAGGGGERDGVAIDLVPYLDEAGAPRVRLKTTFAGMTADGEPQDAPIPPDTWSLGSLTPIGEAWILTTVTIDAVP